jgi:menaquinone-specific isochorismate synthase
MTSELERARDAGGLTTIGFPAPVVPPAALVAAFRGGPLVTWSTHAETVVGIGAARELRGHGHARWDELVAAARALVIGGDVAPKLLGGLAFAPGAADREPWQGFGDAWFVLPRWTYYHDGRRGTLALAIDAREARQEARWREELASLQLALSAGFAARPQPAMQGVERGDSAVWRQQVRAISDAISRGACAKIVAARGTVVALSSEVRPADLLSELDVRHSDCVRLLVRPPAGGVLLAATPERLVRLSGRQIICDALAGSRAPAGEDVAAGTAALLASEKDRREHALVVDAIREALVQLGAEVSAAAEPTVRALRHVLHLHTPIEATLARPRHVLEVAARLHPTPAVGGTPTRFATDWIARHEPLARGWYSAPVGWFDLDGNGELAVALRCGVLAGDRAHLWAGAGIVAGSDPDRELAETELKLRPMLGALGVSA